MGNQKFKQFNKTATRYCPCLDMILSLLPFSPNYLLDLDKLYFICWLFDLEDMIKFILLADVLEFKSAIFPL
jgi:hypothetical protein